MDENAPVEGRVVADSMAEWTFCPAIVYLLPDSKSGGHGTANRSS